MSRPLILIGGGGHCKSVIEAAESAGFKIMGVLDMPEFVGTDILSYKVIGTDDDISKYVDECDFVVTLGFIKDPSLRIRLHQKVMDAGGKFAKIIASTANVSKYAVVGTGTVILHNACVNAGATIGMGCIINTFANIEHGAIIENYCHISTGAMVNGDCKVGKNTFLGSQSVMVNAKSICPNCIIGAGSVVRKDIKVSGIYNGNPAILMKKL